jgi:hypothetical protein
MTLHNLKILKMFKIHCCQQHWLNLKKIMTPLMNNEKKNPIVANNNYKLGLKEVVPPLEKGEEKPIVINNIGSICPNLR